MEYLKDIYRVFDGNLALAIVIAEVAHHSLSTHFSGASGLAENAAIRFHEGPGFRQKLNACNAYPLTAATALPAKPSGAKSSTRRNWAGWNATDTANRSSPRNSPNPSCQTSI